MCNGTEVSLNHGNETIRSSRSQVVMMFNNSHPVEEHGDSVDRYRSIFLCLISFSWQCWVSENAIHRWLGIESRLGSRHVEYHNLLIIHFSSWTPSPLIRSDFFFFFLL